MSELSILKRQVQAQKAHGLVPDSVKMPEPEFFTGTHDGKMVKTFLNACDTYFKLIGITKKNTKALFAKIRLLDTEHTWYDSQGYNETIVTFSTMNSHILDYFISSNYVRKARTAFFACKIG